MVLGGPRSATTWAANWLTTESTICLHDPLLQYPIEHLQRMTFANGKKFGISCTSALLYPDWVNAQHCPKVILYRNVGEINNSLRQLGLVELIENRHLARLSAIKGAMVVPYELLFSPTGAKSISEHLGIQFDVQRHDVIRQMRIEPMWKRLNIGREAVKQLMERIKESR